MWASFRQSTKQKKNAEKNKKNKKNEKHKYRQMMTARVSGSGAGSGVTQPAVSPPPPAAAAAAAVKALPAQLFNAAQQGDDEECRKLVDSGEDVNSKDKDQLTPMHYAAVKGHTSTCTVLKELGADVNAKGKAQETPIHTAAVSGHTRTCTVLKELGADVNAKDKNQQTPLHQAAQKSQTSTCTVLKELGADLTATDVKGRTPLQAAKQQGHTATAAVLIKLSATMDKNRNSNHKQMMTAGSGAGSGVNQPAASPPPTPAAPAVLLIRSAAADNAMAMLLAEEEEGVIGAQRHSRKKKKKKKKKGDQKQQQPDSGQRNDSCDIVANETHVPSAISQKRESELRNKLKKEHEEYLQLQKQCEEDMKQASQQEEADTKQKLTACIISASGAAVRREQCLEQALEDIKGAEATEKKPIPLELAKHRIEFNSGSLTHLGKPSRAGDLTWYTSEAAILGEGSNGTVVYRGTHSQWGHVAVKVVDAQQVPQYRTDREQKLLLKLADESGVGSDNVIKYRCRVDDEDGRRLMLGMELCECSLHQLVTGRQLRPTLEQQCRVVRELCEALVFLHSHQIIHRDIRPKNILFKTNDFDGTVKLTDFGLSKEIETDDADQSFSSTVVQADTEEIASFGFYAPEVYRKEKQTGKVDVFSLGCCLFYLLSGGHRPHEDPKQPTNKYILNVNIFTGQFNLAAIAHLPEAAHMIRNMIDQQKEKRPTVQWLLDWHPYFWSEQKRFEFLCAVGNTEGKKAALQSASMSSRILGKDASDVGGWRKCLDDFVWEDHTSDMKHRQHYNCKSIAHLLRFMRNVKEHPKAGSASATLFESAGGIACYFLQRFPKLLLPVWEAVGRAGWGQSMQSEFKPYLHVQSNASSLPEPVAASISSKTASATSLELPPVDRTVEHDRTSTTESSILPKAKQQQPKQQSKQKRQTEEAHMGAPVSGTSILEWLSSVNPTLEKYAEALADCGFENVGMLMEAEESDLEEAFNEAGVKKFHSKVILKAFAKLQLQ
jgi:serine/threonine protein kinase